MADANFDNNSLGPISASLSTKQDAIYVNSDAADQIFGHSAPVLLSTASMRASASTISYVNTGTAGTGSNSCAPAYPTGSGNNDLILFAGMAKHDKYGGFSDNANFNRAGWSHAAPHFPDYRDAAGRIAANNVLGTDIGPTRTEHHLRFPDASLSGTETFSTTAASNSAAAGYMHRFIKSGAEEWVIKSYGIFNFGDSIDSVVGAHSRIEAVGTKTQFKLSNDVIYGIGNNPGVCTLVVTSGLALFKSITGYEWNSISYPFGTDLAYRVRYGDGTWIMIGANGKVGRSTNNGATWDVTQPLGTGFRWYGVRYYNNRWIACGQGGRLMTSDDGGQNWTQRTSGLTTTIYDVAWGLGYDGDDSEYGHPAWNDGVGRWWYGAQGYRMFKSDDNGDTWSEGQYQTTSPAFSIIQNSNPETLIYWTHNSYTFLAAGNKLADVYDYGYYQNTLNFGRSGGDGLWNPYYSGYSYGMFYGRDVWPKGKFSHVRDVDALIGSNGLSTSRVWWGESRYNGIAIGASSTYPSYTYGYWQHDFYSTSFQRLGKPYREFPALTGYWDTEGNRSYGYFIRDGGTWSIIDGSRYGDLQTYNLNGRGTNEGTWDETVAGGAPDIRDGDLVVVSISVTGASDTISNINIEEYVYTDVPPTLLFSPAIDLGSVTTNSGDRGKIYTKAFYASGLLGSNYLYEDTYYGVGDSRRYKISTGPTVRVTWDANCAAQVQGAFSVVVTVLHTQPFGIDMPAEASLTAEAEVLKVGIQPGAPGSTYTASMTVDSFVEANSTPLYLGAYSVNGTSDSSILNDYAYSPSTGLPVGTCVFVYVVCDNDSASTPTITVSDVSGNTWTQLGWQVQGTRSAAGTTAAIFYSVLTTAIPYAGLIQAQFSATITVRTMVYVAWAGMPSTTQRGSSVTNSGSSATPTVTSGTAESGDLVVAVLGVENDTVPTADSDTYNGSWGSYIATAGGGGAKSQALYAAYKIITGSGAQTFNPSTSPSADWANVIAIMQNAPMKQSGAVMRPVASMTVESTVNRAYDTTAELEAVVPPMDVTGSRDDGVTPVASLQASVLAATQNMADALRIAIDQSEDLDAVADMVVEAWVPQVIDADVPLDAVGNLTATANVQVWHTADATLTAVITDNVTQGDIIDAEAFCTASAEAVANGVYVIVADPDNQPPLHVSQPDPLPGIEGWFKSTSTYGATGSTGNLIELTNRTYQDAYLACTDWPEWPFPNGPGGFWGLGYLGTYTMGARNSAVTPLGDDRFLVTWTQENWVQYYLDWINGQPVQRVLLDVPMILVATVLDCSGTGDPVIVGTSRYEMPLSWRWYRNGPGKQSAQPMGGGKVACTFSGFTIIPDSGINPDYGGIDFYNTNSLHILCKVDASGDTPVFEWVKEIGGLWEGHHATITEVMVHDGDVLMTCFGWSSVVVRKFDGADGSWIESSSAMNIYDSPAGTSSCVYDDTYGYVFGDDTLSVKYAKINLSTLAWSGAKQDVLYRDNSVNANYYMYLSKKGNDGKWYVAGTTASSGAYSVFRLDISDGSLVIAGIHRSEVPNVQNFDEEALTHYRNAYRTYNWIEGWAPIGYVSEHKYSLYSKHGFCPGEKNPSVVGTAAYVTDESQYPEHQVGPQVVAELQEMGADEVARRPKSWISSSPGNAENSNWKNYVTEGKPEFVSDIDCAETSTGKILVVMAGVEDLVDSGYYSSDPSETVEGNGIYRIFAYLADPANEPPPLKMSQRDDDKRAGGKRLGYNPGQESTIRSGWVAW